MSKPPITEEKKKPWRRIVFSPSEFEHAFEWVKKTKEKEEEKEEEEEEEEEEEKEEEEEEKRRSRRRGGDIPRMQKSAPTPPLPSSLLWPEVKFLRRDMAA